MEESIDSRTDKIVSFPIFDVFFFFAASVYLLFYSQKSEAYMSGLEKTLLSLLLLLLMLLKLVS